MDQFKPDSVDLESRFVEGSVAHYSILNSIEWGVTYPVNITLVDAKKQGLNFGYFHQHEDKKVYVKPEHLEKNLRLTCECKASAEIVLE